MSGFEIAGIALAGPAVVQLLLKSAYQGYELFRGTTVAMKEYQRIQHDLNTQQEFFLDWLRALSACAGGDLSKVLDPNSNRYELVLTTLHYIAGVFAEVDQLKEKYGIVPVKPEESRITDVSEVQTKQKSRWLKRIYRKVSHKKQASKADIVKKPGFQLPNESPPVLVRPVPDEEDLPPTLERNASSLQDRITSLGEEGLEVRFPGLERRATVLEKSAIQYQETLPVYAKFEWQIQSKQRLECLVEDLRGYIESLDRLTKEQFNQETAMVTSRPVIFYEFNVPHKLPFPRLSEFCGRGDIFDKIEKVLDPVGTGNGPWNRQVVVLHGMGGLGKSQIALEYAYRPLYAEHYSTVIWIDVTNADTVEKSGGQILKTIIAHYANKYQTQQDQIFAKIAVDLGIPGQINNAGRLAGDAEKSPWSVVRNWMEREKNNQWCLIVDGINTEEERESLPSILPNCSHGHIIITSRVTFPCYTMLRVEVIDDKSGLELLLGTKFGSAAEAVKQAARKIVELLGNLPLAIAQAVAYIKMMGLELAQYLQRLEDDLFRLMNLPVMLGYGKGVFSAWKLSVEALRKRHPEAVSLLRLCSFLSPGGVSEELLKRGLNTMEWMSTGKSGLKQRRLSSAVDNLVQYGLVKRMPAANSGEFESIWIHHLVQYWARYAIDSEGAILSESDEETQNELREHGIKAAILLVSEGVITHYNFRKPVEWIYERTIWDHLKLCWEDYIPKYDLEGCHNGDAELGWAFYNLGYCKIRWNDYAVGKSFIQKGVKLLEKPAAGDPVWEKKLLEAMQMEASTYILYEPTYRSTINIGDRLTEIGRKQRDLLGEDHEDTLYSQALYALYLSHAEKRNAEARDILLPLLKKMKVALYRGNSVYTASLSYLGNICTKLGELKEAQTLLIESFELRKETEGVNTQNGVAAAGQVSRSYQNLGDLEGACKYSQITADAAEATFGLTSLPTLYFLERLHGIYKKLGIEDDATRVADKLQQAREILNSGAG